MRILGIDPGTHRLGYGLVIADGARLSVGPYGCLEPKEFDTPADRLVALEVALQKVLSETKPDSVAIEELYFARNVTTALRVAEARGIALLVARKANLAVAEYKPNLVKSAVASYGLADKTQMGRMVQFLLQLSTVPKPDDAADALAVAICHAAHYRSQNWGARVG